MWTALFLRSGRTDKAGGAEPEVWGGMTMKQEQSYGGLDRFRILAAVLVIAIHTSPLGSYSADADFFLTRILARVAVPFFSW